MVLKQITEEAVEFKKKLSPKNYFMFHPEDVKKSFLVKNNKIFLINNFDVDELFLINKYKNVQLHNLFIFDKEEPRNLNRIRVEMDYLLEVTSIRNFIVVIGFSASSDLN